MDGFIDNISDLADGNLGAMQMPTADEPYDDVKFVSRVTPPAGRYTLQLPESITVGAWPESDEREGSYQLKFDPVKVIAADGEPGAGLEMRFINVSSRRIGQSNCSSATDLLKRLDLNAFPSTTEDWLQAASDLSGAIVSDVYCDWECRAPKDTKTPDQLTALRIFLKGQRLKVTDPKARKIVLRGMTNFPVKDKTDGVTIYRSKLVFGDQDENAIGPAYNGDTLTLYANLVPTLRGFALTPEERAERNGA